MQIFFFKFFCLQTFFGLYFYQIYGIIDILSATGHLLPQIMLLNILSG